MAEARVYPKPLIPACGQSLTTTSSAAAPATGPPRPLLPRRPPSSDRRRASGQRQEIPERVLDAKLETVNLGSCLQHFTYRRSRSARDQFVRIEERWVRDATPLGNGSHGIVYRERCEGHADRVRALKEIRRAVLNREGLDYTRELEAIVKFSHPRYAHRFVHSDGWFENGDSIFISMEYLELGDLSKYITRPFPELEAQQVVSQVLDGLRFMHENRFVHRDLKPGNIMVVSGRPVWFVKITDFGISKRRQADATSLASTSRFTLSFASPEQLGITGDASAKSCSFPTDIWSLGAVAFQLLTCSLPFSVQDMIKFVGDRSRFPVAKLQAEKVSGAGQDFIRTLMAPSPWDRPTASTAASHSWVPEPLAHPLDNGNEGSASAVPAFGRGEATEISVASAAWTEEEHTATLERWVEVDDMATTARTTSKPPAPSAKSVLDESSTDPGHKPHSDGARIGMHTSDSPTLIQVADSTARASKADSQVKPSRNALPPRRKPDLSLGTVSTDDLTSADEEGAHKTPARTNSLRRVSGMQEQSSSTLSSRPKTTRSEISRTGASGRRGRSPYAVPSGSPTPRSQPSITTSRIVSETPGVFSPRPTNPAISQAMPPKQPYALLRAHTHHPEYEPSPPEYYTGRRTRPETTPESLAQSVSTLYDEPTSTTGAGYATAPTTVQSSFPSRKVQVSPQHTVDDVSLSPYRTSTGPTLSSDQLQAPPADPLPPTTATQSQWPPQQSGPPHAAVAEAVGEKEQKEKKRATKEPSHRGSREEDKKRVHSAKPRETDMLQNIVEANRESERGHRRRETISSRTLRLAEKLNERAREREMMDSAQGGHHRPNQASKGEPGWWYIFMRGGKKNIWESVFD